MSIGLTPVHSYLHRVFPPGFYDDSADQIVRDRLFKPRRDCEPFKLEDSIDWESPGRLQDRNWRMQLQGWTMFHPVMNFFDDYSNKQEITAFLMDIASGWWQRYGEDPDDIVTTRMPDSYAWYDMSVGFRALILGFFLERLAADEHLSAQVDIRLLQEISRKHIRHLSNPKTFSLNNHGFFQIQGLVALINGLDPKAFSGERRYALAKMEELICAQFDEAGIHLEHSPHYHFYALDTVEAVLDSGWYVDSTVIGDRARRAREVRPWIVDPLKRPFCIGDSILTEQKSIEWPEPPIRKHHGVDHLVSSFSGSGYASIRSPWDVPPDQASALFVTGMYHSKAHKHRDCLSFEWFDRGERIVCDGGKYGYKSDPNRRYVLSSRAHNSVEIEGFDILKMSFYESALEEVEALGGELYRVSGELTFPALSQRRTYYFKPGRWVVVIDELDFKRARKFTQWFHTEPRYNITRVCDNSVRLDTKSGRTLFVDNLNPDLRCSLHRNDTYAMQGLISEKDYRIVPAVAMGFSGSTQKNVIVSCLALGTAEREEALGFAAQFQPRAVEVVGLQEPARPEVLSDLETSTVFALDQLELKQGERVYRVLDRGSEIYFHAQIKDHKNLIVFLPGATSRKRSWIDFQRHTWAPDFPCSVITLSDPTIREDNDLTLGWFQGTSGIYAIEKVGDLIEAIIERGGYKPDKVLLFGSSGGGFAALKLGARLRDTPVICINPQLYLYNYTKTHYEHMLAVSYPGKDHKQVFREHKGRITVDEASVKRKAPTYLIQNKADARHMNRHLSPFLKKLSSNEYITGEWPEVPRTRDFCVIHYTDEALGHSPPDQETTLQMISSIFKTIRFKGQPER